MTDNKYPLWSDEPADRDLLSFDAVAATVVDAVLDDRLDPIALGLSGSWGSGKTSVLELVQQAITERSAATDTKVLVIKTQPWSYDPAVGPKAGSGATTFVRPLLAEGNSSVTQSR